MKNRGEKNEPTIELEPELLFSVETATSASVDHPEQNEDMVLGAEQPELAAKLQERSIYGVFDGVSSADGGASSREANAVVSARLAELPPDADIKQTQAALKNALLAADQALGSTGKKATTADVLRILDNDDGSQELVYAHIGDSRIMVLDGETDELRNITIDHGMAGAAYREKAITREEYDLAMSAKSENDVPDHLYMATKYRNKIYAALGHREKHTPDHGHETLPPGSKILITSDGIHDNLTPAEIADLMRADASMEEIRAKSFERAEAKAMLNDLEMIEKSLKKDGNLKKNAYLTEQQEALYRGLGNRENLLKAQAELVNQDDNIKRGKRDDITGVLIELKRPEAERAGPADREVPPLPPELQPVDPDVVAERRTAAEEEDQNGLGEARDQIAKM